MSSIDHNLKRDSYDPKFLSPEPQQEHVDSAGAESAAPVESQPEPGLAPAEQPAEELDGKEPANGEQSAPEPEDAA